MARQRTSQGDSGHGSRYREVQIDTQIIIYIQGLTIIVTQALAWKTKPNKLPFKNIYKNCLQHYQ